MMDRPPTPPATLTRARDIALGNGVRYAYTGNVRDLAGGTTWCAGCAEPVIERDGYRILGWALTGDGRCRACGTRCPGVFEGAPGHWGARRRPVQLRSLAL
jgi:pyruvate formate lyase activating enzyme